jgi:crossover junction endodeoxyribonuclease RusA
MIGRIPRTLISRAGRLFRDAVAGSFWEQFPGHRAMAGRLSVIVDLFPRDRRQTDIDNYAKSLLDALTHAGVWVDDSQIDRLTLVRGEMVKGGRCVVTIMEVNQ